MSIQTISSMVDWVEANISREPTLDQMSEHVGYSSYYCSSKFHENIGLSFKSYVIKRKLTSASLDLLRSNDRIIDIALKYGFSSHEAFTRSFLREFGCTPSKFRREKPPIQLFKRHVIKHSI